MDDILFKIDPVALVLETVFLLLVLAFYFLRKDKALKPTLFFSEINFFKQSQKSLRLKLSFIPNVLKVVALSFFLLAFLDPLIFTKKKNDSVQDTNNQANEEVDKREEVLLPTEGIGIYLLLDQSGSMNQNMLVDRSKGSKRHTTRIEALKQTTQQFIQGTPRNNSLGRKNDLIGLVSFARVAHIIAPLTLDHESIVKTLSELKTVDFRDEDGTAIGYAIYKTANTIALTKYFSEELIGNDKPSYVIKNTIMIMITDGLQNPNPLDGDHSVRNISVKNAAEFSRDKGIKLYIVNIEPLLAQPEYAEERRELVEAANITGGKFFLAGGIDNLQQIYDEIDLLEKSSLENQKHIQAIVKEKVNPQDDYSGYNKHPLYLYLIAIGAFCLFLSYFFSSTIFKKVP